MLLIILVTCYYYSILIIPNLQEVTHNMRYRTIRWSFLHSIEPAKVVYARCTDVISKENVFAQVTCRFFTKQVVKRYLFVFIYDHSVIMIFIQIDMIIFVSVLIKSEPGHIR